VAKTRRYNLQSPAVQQMADLLEHLWNKTRGALIRNPKYRAAPGHRRTFEKAAISVLSQDLNPRVFIQAQLRTRAGAQRCQPSYLTGPKAMERYKQFIQVQESAELGVYISQLQLIQRLREIGRDWDHIEQGSYNLSPLVLWAMFVLNGMEDRAEPYYRHAKAEYARGVELEALFGAEITRLA